MYAYEDRYLRIQYEDTFEGIYFLFCFGGHPVVPEIPSPMSASVKTIGRGEQLHHLLVFFSNRAVYAQVLRKVDSHVSSNLIQLLCQTLMFCANARLNLWLVRADSSCSKHNRESAEGNLNEPWKWRCRRFRWESCRGTLNSRRDTCGTLQQTKG